MAPPQDVFRVGRATVTNVENIVLDNSKPSQLIPDWDAKVSSVLPNGCLTGHRTGYARKGRATSFLR